MVSITFYSTLQTPSAAGSGTSTTTSSSASSLVSTLAPVAALAAVYIIIFLILRAKYLRVYQPRTFLPTLHENERRPQLPDGKFNWLVVFKSIHDEDILNRQSLDGYFYLRFFRLLTKICFVGCCITFTVLFPVNATGSGGQKELDILSFSNIARKEKSRYYAHTFVAWIFLSFVMFMITKETIFFINLRQNYMLSPFNEGKISSRTVLFTSIPEEYMDPMRLGEVLGGVFDWIWMVKDCKELTDKVEERDAIAIKLENAEIKLIKAVNDRRLKWEKKVARAERKGKPVPERRDVDTQTRNISEWMKAKDRPTHRSGKVPFGGEKVDTIGRCREKLQTLNEQIETQKQAIAGEEWRQIPAAFVEFRTQFHANKSCRVWSARNKMEPRAIGVAPKEIIWENLEIKRNERALRVFATATFLTAMIIFWAVPVAVIGAISNINYLTAKVPFLSFINSIPPVILGIITGLLPSVALSILMALVPIVCRWMGKLSGEVTTPAVELKCQNWYFAFQVIQVFFVTTLSSGAASAVSRIIEDPSSATTLLAQSLPKASNFFICYIIVQGLGIAAGNLINIGALFMLTIGGKFLDKSPRKMYNRYITLAGLGWGSLYPKFCCLGVIAISYSCIAPLLLVTVNSLYIMSPAINMNDPAKPDDIPLTEVENHAEGHRDCTVDSEAFRSGLLFKVFDSQIFRTDWPDDKFTFRNQEAPTYAEDARAEAYFNPAMIRPAPIVWIVKDVMNISAKEVQDTHGTIRISDAHATFNGVGDIEWDQEKFDRVPIGEDKICY
ncbi:hypothetical protein DID88_001100 [Monilinia fructigena]|uniref:CSC1/OSCA1-like 7TM region domain-containing protein n=1 Tax=Monilinia fructigena TaxID=38457 RepID=A0A395IZ49_9HELO|nr:hypothetical protein DID88_001100 [Monilinia fructigena]